MCCILKGVGYLWPIRPSTARAICLKIAYGIVDCIVHIADLVRWKANKLVKTGWISRINRGIVDVDIQIQAFIVADPIFTQETADGRIKVSGAVIVEICFTLELAGRVRKGFTSEPVEFATLPSESP